MAGDDDRIRLPELPIFKKYSLALRHEFASPKEILAALERSETKVQKLLDKAEERRRRMELQGEGEPERGGSELEGPGEFEAENVAEQSVSLDERAVSPVGEEDRDDFEVTAVFDQIDEAVDGDSEAASPEPDAYKAPAWEPGTREKETWEPGPGDVPIWEPEPTQARGVKSSPAPGGGRRRKRPARPAAKKKRRRPRIDIVPVSSRGTPLRRPARKKR